MLAYGIAPFCLVRHILLVWQLRELLRRYREMAVLNCSIFIGDSCDAVQCNISVWVFIIFCEILSLLTAARLDFLCCFSCVRRSCLPDPLSLGEQGALKDF